MKRFVQISKVSRRIVAFATKAERKDYVRRALVSHEYNKVVHRNQLKFF